MGGRLDSTNVITPLVSVVTKIAREHTDYLGNDLASIAREKAGIAKRGVPFITGEMDPAVRQVLVHQAHGHRAFADRLWEKQRLGHRAEHKNGRE